MIAIELTSGPEGFLVGLDSIGHAALHGQAQSVPCALVSGALYSFGVLAARNRGLRVSGSLGQTGRYRLRVEEISPACRDWYRGMCDLLIQSLETVQRDHPDQIRLTYNNI